MTAPLWSCHVFTPPYVPSYISMLTNHQTLYFTNMEDIEGREIGTTGDGHQQISTASAVGAAAAALSVGGPLLCLMCFTFLATTTLFLVASPLLLIFSPVLLGAMAVLMAALAGFGAAGVMWVTGLGVLVWIGRQMGVGGGVVERMVESAGVRVKEIGNDRRDYLRDKSEDDLSQANSS